jgi:hypothetical protein
MENKLVDNIFHRYEEVSHRNKMMIEIYIEIYKVLSPVE